jgi:hypothetical protein
MKINGFRFKSNDTQIKNLPLVALDNNTYFAVFYGPIVNI